MRTTRSGSENGRPRRKRSCIKLKIAVFMPMPSASVSTARKVNPGDLRSWRRAKWRSFMIAVSLKVFSSFCAQRDDRIHTCSTASWHAAGDQRNCQKRKHSDQHSSGIDGADVVKQRHQRATRGNCTDQSDYDAI